jgi:hypothetical protein
LPLIDMKTLKVDGPKHVDPYAELRKFGVEPPTAGFSDLKEAIVQILLAGADASSWEVSCFVHKTAQNRFLCAVLSIVSFLLLCGHYDDNFKDNEHTGGVLFLGEEAKKLGRCLVPVLDGRTDQPGDSSRFELSAENSILMQMKHKILSIL